jgi:predicted dehydrogenase
MEHRPETTPFGVAVIGQGTIGRLRATLARASRAVGSVVVCDIDKERLEAGAELVGADLAVTDFEEAIATSGVAAVVVSTTESEHFAPVMAAIERGLPVLVEKPLTLSPAEANSIVVAAARTDVPVCVGFTQRFRRRYQTAKELQLEGAFGDLSSITSRIYITRAVAETVIARAPSTTPSINTLTYAVDLALWYANGARPLRVHAVHSRGEIFERFGAPDATWALVEFEKGLSASLGVSWEPPRHHPAQVASMNVELMGAAGMISIVDDHRDQVLVTDTPRPSPYPPHAPTMTAFMGSAMPGTWALGRFYGPMRAETDAFLEGVATGRMPLALPAARHGFDVLQLCLAIDKAAVSGQPVNL